ncbi:MAG: hypothetical protein ACLR0U_10120 [Enterocloster clostridioformis]
MNAATVRVDGENYFVNQYGCSGTVWLDCIRRTCDGGVFRREGV